MKFTCDSCQAKYQIADEKVAGKTVRMKCRKCGHPIQVRARQTAAGVEAVVVAPKPAAAAEPPTGRPSSPPRPVPVPPRPGGAAVRTGGAAARLGAPLPPAGARTPSSSSSSSAGTGARGAEFRGLGGGTPRGFTPFGPSAPLKKDIAAPAPDVGFEDDEATTVMQRPLLEDLQAFSAQLPSKEERPRPAAGSPAAAPEEPESGDSASAGEPSPAAPLTPDEPEPDDIQWFVGIAGTPVGPKPEVFLREKLGAGIIDGDSLVWHEQMDDWKPLRDVSDLSHLLDAASPPAAAAVVGGSGSGAPVVGGAADGSADGVPPAQVSDPLALMKVKQGQASGGADAALGGTSDSDLAKLAVESDELDELARDRGERRRKKRRGVSPVVYAFVAMAGGFGAVAAYVVFSSPPSSVTPAATTAANTAGQAGGQASSTAVSSAEPAGSTVVLAEVQVDPESVAASASPAGEAPAAGTGKPAASGSAAADIDTSGFDSPGPAGPSARPSGGDGDATRSQLSTAEIQGVVNRYKGGVSRRCLPIVEGGSPSGATSARVVAHLTVGPSGSVVSASASGGKDFPGLSSCVAGRVRNWKFPASSGTTRVDVPFHFIAQ